MKLLASVKDWHPGKVVLLWLVSVGLVFLVGPEFYWVSGFGGGSGRESLDLDKAVVFWMLACSWWVIPITWRWFSARERGVGENQ